MQCDYRLSKRSGRIVRFAPAKFSLVWLVESIYQRQMSLSCRHPSGSRPGFIDPPGPIPTVSGPEQRQYRTLFNPGPSRRTDLTGIMTGPVERGLHPCVTRGTGERDSNDLGRFVSSRPMWRPSNQAPGFLTSPHTRSTATSSTHPNTRDRSKASWRFIM